MQLFHIERLEVAGPVTVLIGSIHNDGIAIGDDVLLTASDGQQERVTVVALTESADALSAAKVLIRRSHAVLRLAVGMTLRRIEPLLH